LSSSENNSPRPPALSCILIHCLVYVINVIKAWIVGCPRWFNFFLFVWRKKMNFVFICIHFWWHSFYERIEDLSYTNSSSAFKWLRVI
jgi:hypothetical protein